MVSLTPTSTSEADDAVLCSLCGLILSRPVCKTCCHVYTCMCCELLAATYLSGDCVHCGATASTAAVDDALDEVVHAHVTKADETHEWPHFWRETIGLELHSCSVHGRPFLLRPAYRETFKNMIEERCDELLMARAPASAQGA